MSLLRADKIANRFNNTGPVLVGPSTVSGNLIVTNKLQAFGIGVTRDVFVSGMTTTKFLTVQNYGTLNQTTLTGITTAGIITGATYWGNGANLSGIVTGIAAGAGIVISPTSGEGRITITASGVPNAQYAALAGVTSDIQGGSAGKVVYQSGTDSTAFTAVGSVGQLLQSNATGAPSWTNLSAIAVGYAASAGIATNLKGGAAGRLPYQSGIDQTAFIPAGSTGRILLAQGSLAPTWIDPKVSLNVNYANEAGISTNVIGGVSSVTSLDVSGITTLSDFTNVTDTLQVGSGSTTDVVAQILQVGGDAYFSGGIGIGTTNIAAAADPNNASRLNVGIVTANFFYGDGSQLVGVADTANVRTNTLVVTGFSTLSSVSASGNVTVAGDSNVSGSAYVVGNVGVGTTNALSTLQVGSALSSFTVVDSGNSTKVGIGTTAPELTLDVRGDANVSGNLTKDGNSVATIGIVVALS